MFRDGGRLKRPFTRQIGFLIAVQSAFALAATPAWADAGTPLVWTFLLHLFIGNLLIGILEGLVLARVFKLPRTRTILLLIPANYLSAFAGVGYSQALGALIGRYDPAPLYHVRSLLLGALVLSYFLSALVEWPFCLAATWRRPDRVAASWKATLLAQSVSYPLLILVYFAGPAVTAPVGAEVDPTLSFARGVRAVIYFVPPEGGSVWRVHADGSDLERVYEGSVSADEGIFFQPSNDGEHWDLWARDPERLLTRMTDARPDPRWVAQETREYKRGDGCMSLRGEMSWQVIPLPWPDVGLNAWHGGEREIRVTLGTPLLVWSARWATLFPDCKVVFQLGEQVVFLDLNTKKLGVIAHGGSPAVLMKSR